MWVVDPQRETGITGAQLYVTPQEARELRDALTKLLADPEADEHEHLGAGAEFSISIVTARKLREAKYSALERRVLAS